MAGFRARLTYANVMSTMAVFLALGGSAVAAGVLRITSKNVPKNALTGADIKNIKGADVKNESLTGKDVKDGSLLIGDFGGELPGGPTGPTGPAGPAGPEGPSSGAAGGDLTGNYPDPAIADNAVNDAKIADNSIDSGEIVDFTLTNQDVGVLFAEVDADGTLANSSGSVTSERLVGGAYEVDFGRDVASCTAVATIGAAGVATAEGEINVADRLDNAEGVFVRTANSAGTVTDKPFRLVVVC